MASPPRKRCPLPNVPAASGHLRKACADPRVRATARLPERPHRTGVPSPACGRSIDGEDRRSAMLVKEFMTRRAETIEPDETLETAARRMRERGVGALVVCEAGRAIGILTDRDIVVRSTAEGAPPAEADVRGAMTPQV